MLSCVPSQKGIFDEQPHAPTADYAGHVATTHPRRIRSQGCRCRSRDDDRETVRLPHFVRDRRGRPGAVLEFYSNHFIPNLPADLELTSLSQTFGDNRIAEEMVVRFTHSIDMDWLLPGLRPTHRRAEFVLAAIIEFEAGKVAHEHLYWDQATLLSQMGVLDHPMAAAGVGSAAQLLKLR